VPKKSVNTAIQEQSAKLKDGIEAFQKGEYERAKMIFKKVIESTRNPADLEEAQWHLALVAQKQGKVEEAKRQYTAFIENFPGSGHIAEANQKLALLARPLPSSGAEEPSAPVAASQKTSAPYSQITGSLTTEYFYGLQTSPEPSTEIQNTLSEYLDLRWRRKAKTDLRFTLQASYSHDFLDSENTEPRVTKLYFEGNSLLSVMDLRFGRQPSSGDTLFTRFDGMTATYRPFQSAALTVSGGYPVYTSEDPAVLEVNTERSFYETYLSYFDVYRLTGRIYYTEEYDQGFTTRNAAGINGYWLRDNLTVTYLLDYDFNFDAFNDELLGVDYTRKNVRYSVAAEYRKNPFLDFETALSDLSLIEAAPLVTDLDTLLEGATSEEVEALVLANTSDALDFRLGAQVDFSKVWRGDFRLSHTISKVVNFEEGKARKTSERLSVFFSERNGLGLSEYWTLLLLYQPSTDSDTATTITTLTKYWGGRFQTGLKFRWERIELKTVDTLTTRIVPGLTASYTLKSGMYFSLDSEYMIENNTGATEPTKTVTTRTGLTVPF
jgi:tetratricopeptide (TPR) repeat protein